MKVLRWLLGVLVVAAALSFAGPASADAPGGEWTLDGECNVNPSTITSGELGGGDWYLTFELYGACMPTDSGDITVANVYLSNDDDTVNLGIACWYRGFLGCDLESGNGSMTATVTAGQVAILYGNPGPYRLRVSDLRLCLDSADPDVGCLDNGNEDYTYDVETLFVDPTPPGVGPDWEQSFGVDTFVNDLITWIWTYGFPSLLIVLAVGILLTLLLRIIRRGTSSV